MNNLFPLMRHEMKWKIGRQNTASFMLSYDQILNLLLLQINFFFIKRTNDLRYFKNKTLTVSYLF